MKLVFFGGGSFAAAVLRHIHAVHEICMVVTPPPQAANRKLKPVLPPAAQEASLLQLPLCHAMTPAQLQALDNAVSVVCDYGKILPPELLAAGGNVLNIHPSLLPRWRGAAPIERAILAGDSETGVSIMQVSEKLDCGAVLAQQTIALDDAPAVAALYPLLAHKGAALLLQVLDNLSAYPALMQDDTAATYANKITAADRLLDFNASAMQCCRQVLAFAPTPGAHFFLGEKRLRIRVLAAQVVPDITATPATVIAADKQQGIVIACADGALAIHRLQREGRKAMDSGDFLRGFPLQGGDTIIAD